MYTYKNEEYHFEDDETQELLPYQKRVVDEVTSLESRIINLTNFIYSEKFDQLTRLEQELLKQQLKVMQQYATILITRIHNFLKDQE